MKENAALHRSQVLPTALKKVVGFFEKNVVLSIAITAAVITSVIVPPDAKYIGYFDFKTLSCLFSMLAVVCALRNVRFFTTVASKIIALAGNLRRATISLVYITFIGSMFIANDMALLTFLPLGYFMLTMTGNEKSMAYLFILQNIAANLGGMLTPFGNPQNLYIYSKFNIDTIEFMGIMLPPFLVSVSIITACCLFVKPVTLVFDSKINPLPRKKTALYVALFCLSVIMVFRIVPYYVGTLIIAGVLLFVDREALKKVDYPLLLTFCAFFVFAGNMSRIGAIRDIFASIPERFTLLYSSLSCQFISNVPSAILLSQFTSNYPDLLLGVNIGGVGTIIASLASLITFREFSKHNAKKEIRRYIGLFSLLNFGFLIILLAFEYLIK